MAQKGTMKKKVRTVGCPRCGAKPGHNCRKRGGPYGMKIQAANHMERVNLYRWLRT